MCYIPVPPCTCSDCPPSQRLSTRAHHFSDCPVAAVIRGIIQQELLRAFPDVRPVLLRRHIWIMQRPARSIHVQIWRVICLAALRGMDAGRRCMWSLHKRQPQLPLDVIRTIAEQAARCHFAAALNDFASLNRLQPSARAALAVGPAVFFHQDALRPGNIAVQL